MEPNDDYVARRFGVPYWVPDNSFGCEGGHRYTQVKTPLKGTLSFSRFLKGTRRFLQQWQNRLLLSEIFWQVNSDPGGPEPLVLKCQVS